MVEQTDTKANDATPRSRLPVQPPRSATIVAYAALIPLAIGIALTAFGGVGIGEEDLRRGFIAYAALLLTFYAGARFGHGLRATGTTLATSITVTPAGIALLSLFLPPSIASGVLAVTCAGQGAWDVWSADRATLAAWYGRLRLRTTPIAVLFLIAGVFVMA